MATNWIKEATKNKGGLHRALGVKLGTKIPASKMKLALHSKDVKTRKKAILAQTLSKFK